MSERVEVKVQGDSSKTTSMGTPGDLSKYSGSTATERIHAAIDEIPVAIFGKTWCPFCLEISQTFNRLGVAFTQFNIDSDPSGGEVHAALKAAYKQATVPYVFIGKEFIGGCDSVKALQTEGKLDSKLRAAGCAPKNIGKSRAMENLALLEGKPRVPGTLFAFPEAADDRVVRITSFFCMVISILVSIYYDHSQAHYVMLGLAIDFFIRFLGGAAISPLGSLAMCVVSIMEVFGSKPKWMAGPPKQFATFCGLMFAALSAFFFLLERYDSKFNYVGLSLSAALACPTAMEAFLGFCLGCWMFGLGIQFGLVPKEIYAIFTNIKPELEYTWAEMNERKNEDPPERHVRNLIDADHPLCIDYKYKAKTDDWTREDLHLIKHVKIMHFLMPMGVAGLACAWKAASFTISMEAPTAVYYAIALLSVLLEFIWAVLYGLKMIMYPLKVHKEWMCPVRGNAFVVPLINLVLFAFLVSDESHTLAVVLFWIGCPAIVFLALFRMAMWIASRRDIEHINAAWMIMPVSNFVSAFVAAWLLSSYNDWAQFLFAFAFISWLLLLALTFQKAILKHEEDDRLRPLLAIWVAAPAAAGVAYLFIWQPAALTSPTSIDSNDFIFINLTWISVVLGLVLGLCFYPSPFFGRIKFDMGYWAAGFPSAALAIVTIMYNIIKPGPLGYGIAITCLSVASVLNCVLLLQTLTAHFRMRLFIPDYKWGPLSFMRLTHEAFRGAMPKLVDAVEMVANGDTSEAAVELLKEHWRLMNLMHDVHSKHEDLVIFKTYHDYFPGLVQPYNDEHEQHHELMAKIDESMETVAKTGASALLPMLKDYSEIMERHLRSEEDHLVGMPRKYVPLAIHKDIIRRVWEMSPVEVWAEYLPWAVNNLPMLVQRVRFLKTFLWAMPERGQQIGIILGKGIDGVQWKRITDELPEVIPRGATGWERYN